MRPGVPGRARQDGARRGGPGYHIAALQTSEDFWEDDGTAWEETAEQVRGRPGTASRSGSASGGGSRTGSACYSVLDRTMAGEDVAEPWAGLSGHVPDVQLWRVPQAERWVALGVSQWDKGCRFSSSA